MGLLRQLFNMGAGPSRRVSVTSDSAGSVQVRLFFALSHENSLLTACLGRGWGISVSLPMGIGTERSRLALASA
jgi:hypothetical protein